ncbi:mitochondrial inner membrane protein Mitofilin [Phycomyces nitens]|nr:mitochondrial inner membrane protein Mitofilin [Phycomyces nitens]
MLRVSRVVNSGLVPMRTLGKQRHAIPKRFQSTSSGSSSNFGTALVGGLLLSVAAYGGAAYYAWNNERVRDTYTLYVPGGQQIIDSLEDLQENKELQARIEKAKALKKQADEYAALARDYTAKAQVVAEDAYDYSLHTYYNVSGTPSATKTYDGPTPTRTRSAFSADEQHAQAPRPEDIRIQKVASDVEIVNDLSCVVADLTRILNAAGLADKGRKVIQDAQDHLNKLDAQCKELSDNERAILKGLKELGREADEMDSEVAQLKLDARESLDVVYGETFERSKAKAAELQKLFDQIVADTQNSFSQLLKAELHAQQSTLDLERMRALAEQSQVFDHQFKSQVTRMLEEERARRLKKLERVRPRLEAIAPQSLDNAAHLDRSRQIHQMHVTLDALESAIYGPKQPFDKELVALSNSAKGFQLLTDALDLVPMSVAQEGVDHLETLADRFERVAKEVRHVALVPEDGGLGAHIISMVISKLLFKKNGLVKGDDVEATLSRAKYYLDHRDLENAARELNQLKGWPKRLASDWIEAARNRLEVEQALEVARTQVNFGNLLNSK